MPDQQSTPAVFLSYSHKDEVWKDRLEPHLQMLAQEGWLEIWDDRQIGYGSDWYEEIGRQMASTAVSVCLISPDYLASDFCVKEEIPFLLERQRTEGMLLIPVLIRRAAWERIGWLRGLQILPRDGKPVAAYGTEWDTPFAELADFICEYLEERVLPEPLRGAAPAWAAPKKVDIGRLPVTGAELFGRQEELELLDEAWESSVNVVSLVGWGGVGKSTLVNQWLRRMATDNYRGAQRVYGWSFYSQGTGKQVTSADRFVASALEWFGAQDVTSERSPWARGRRLAGLVRQRRTLLVLDGMEPLQSVLGYKGGAIQDPALATFVAELARENTGLCVITTRLAVPGLSG